MKALVILTLLFSLTLSANAQLNNTNWKGTIMAPSEVNVVLQFKKDTLNIVIAGTDDVIESMKYSVKDDVITINKIAGGSPCSNDVTATIKYDIKDTTLVLVPLTDPCDERKNAWPPEGFIKQ
jgi:hypothetical protein